MPAAWWWIPAWLAGSGALWVRYSNAVSGQNFWQDHRDRLRLAARPLAVWDQLWQANPQRADIVICLSTLPSRLPHIAPTLKSLLYQTRPPRRIRLHLPDYSVREQRPYAAPPAWSALGALELVRCPDYGPATKFIPAVQQLPAGQRLLVVDDDRLYPPGLVANFERWAQALPDAALGAAGWIVPPDLTDRELTWWRDLRQIPPAPLKSTRIRAPRRVHILEGYAGCLVRPEFFDPAALADYSAAPPAAFYVDDVWLSAHCRAPRWVIPADRHVFEHWDRRVFQRTALWRINNGGGDPERRNNTRLIRHFRERWELLSAGGRGPG